MHFFAVHCRLRKKTKLLINFFLYLLMTKTKPDLTFLEIFCLNAVLKKSSPHLNKKPRFQKTMKQVPVLQLKKKRGQKNRSSFYISKRLEIVYETFFYSGYEKENGILIFFRLVFTHFVINKRFAAV